jgi:hypothetical protein
MQRKSNKLKIISSKSLTAAFFLAVGFFSAQVARAVCPLCVIGVGAGLGFSRWFGVDDTVSSIWIGAILVALVMWTIIEMHKRNKKFTFDVAIISLAYYLLTLVPLYYAGIIGHPLNEIFGIDKIIFGIAIGTVVFLLSYWLHSYLKKRNNGKAFFSYQKVVLPFATLILTSIIFYLLIAWRII